MPKRRHSGEGFPYDATPDVHHFPGVPQSSFDVVNMYGTYNPLCNIPHCCLP